MPPFTSGIAWTCCYIWFIPLCLRSPYGLTTLPFPTYLPMWGDACIPRHLACAGSLPTPVPASGWDTFYPVPHPLLDCRLGQVWGQT